MPSRKPKLEPLAPLENDGRSRSPSPSPRTPLFPKPVRIVVPVAIGQKGDDVSYADKTEVNQANTPAVGDADTRNVVDDGRSNIAELGKKSETTRFNQSSTVKVYKQRLNRTSDPFSPEYSIQTMSMTSVIDTGFRNKFKERVAMKATFDPLKDASVTVSGGATVSSPKVPENIKWQASQFSIAAPANTKSLPLPKHRLSGKNAMTKAEEIEWKLSDILPALATNHRERHMSPNNVATSSGEAHSETVRGNFQRA